MCALVTGVQTCALPISSGTSGNPKGVMLSNASIAFAIDNILEHTIAAKAHEVLFSYLPLAHLMERIFGAAMGLAVGAEMHFLEKPEAIAETLARVSPTRFSGVPRAGSEERRVGQGGVSTVR